MKTKAKPTVASKVGKATTPRKNRTFKRASQKTRKKVAGITARTSNKFEVKEFCQRYRIVRPDLTRLTGYSLRSVDKWAAGEKPGAPAKKQLAELVRLFDALTDLMENEDVGPWLKEPNPAFANSTPLQVIERGETDRIWHMIYQLETGEPA